MKISTIVRALVAAKATPEMILAAVEAAESDHENALEKRREADRERQARKRKKDSCHVTSRDVTVTVSSHARGEDNLQTKIISGQEGKKEKAAPKALSDLSAFKADLEQDASPEQVEAFAKHRKAKNGQNSAYAAKLFRRDASACGLSVSEAIDTAISRGWLTVRPEYLAGRRQSTAPPQQGGQQDFNVILDNLQGKNSHDAFSGPTFDGSVNRADSGGAPNLVQLHAFSARR